MLDFELRSATIQKLKNILNHLYPAGGAHSVSEDGVARDGAGEASAPSAAGDGAGEAGDEAGAVSVATGAEDEAGASGAAPVAHGAHASGDAVPAASLEEYGAEGSGEEGDGDKGEGEAAAVQSGSVDVVVGADHGGSAVLDAGEHAAQQLAGSRPSATASSPVDLMETLPLVPPGLEAEAWPPRPWIPKSSLRRWLPTKSKDWGKMFIVFVCVCAHLATDLILFDTGQESTPIELEAGYSQSASSRIPDELNPIDISICLSIYLSIYNGFE